MGVLLNFRMKSQSKNEVFNIKALQHHCIV